MRDVCHHCRLPNSLCLCHAAEVIASGTKISVLQHPEETTHAKNTLRLASLCLPNIRIFKGENAKDFEALRALCREETHNSHLIYPGGTSQAMELVAKVQLQSTHLLFIDATWRKAHKMLSLNPWLQALPCYHFNNAPTSHYTLRKTHRTDGLSTLEAIAYSVELVEQIDVAPLHRIQALWVERKRQMMPEDVQKNYDF